MSEKKHNELLQMIQEQINLDVPIIPLSKILMNSQMDLSQSKTYKFKN